MLYQCLVTKLRRQNASKTAQYHNLRFKFDRKGGSIKGCICCQNRALTVSPICARLTATSLPTYILTDMCWPTNEAQENSNIWILLDQKDCTLSSSQSDIYYYNFPSLASPLFTISPPESLFQSDVDHVSESVSRWKQNRGKRQADTNQSHL